MGDEKDIVFFINKMKNNFNYINSLWTITELYKNWFFPKFRSSIIHWLVHIQIKLIPKKVYCNLGKNYDYPLFIWLK